MPSELPRQVSTARLPNTVSLRWCTRCPRTDRFTNLKARHYNAGKLCPGEVCVATYRLHREGAADA